ncbi:MAG: hypothetical protein OEY99_02410, partial [Aigarchaeota archaeon]|nr:hypothetical protein [Aigarchaeota archaeon]
ICGHYREKMNFTKKGLQNASRQLEDLRDMIKRLADSKTVAAESDETVEGLINSLTARFEEHMNDDLDVKGASDAVFEIVSRLKQLETEGRFSRDDAGRTLHKLKRIDGVLQVIFPRSE